ncbi:MAG: transposase [Rhodospirillaceae bacterium]|jgi:transposase-like protein|nr:transposase [Rhodospirillaceae bacterium]MBT5049592.1 transposase [Rhodospirillaceae bacterium]MBT5456594.1 transposase [Rhodospirillaceae bacterium]
MPRTSDPIFVDETAARSYLEAQRWPGGAVCPFCDQQKTVKALRGKSMGDGWYHCKACRRKFTVRVGTLYERSHVPLHKWLLATHILCGTGNITPTADLIRLMIGVSYKTAWHVTHRIREALDAPSP